MKWEKRAGTFTEYMYGCSSPGSSDYLACIVEQFEGFDIYFYMDRNVHRHTHKKFGYKTVEGAKRAAVKWLKDHSVGSE